VVSIDSHKKPPAKKDEEKPFSPINIKHQLLCVYPAMLHTLLNRQNRALNIGIETKLKTEIGM
jgi:hypothetical protein